MKWFNDLKIANKLSLVFGIVLALTCILGGFSLYELSKVNNTSKDMANHLIPIVKNTSNLEITASRIHTLQQNIAQTQILDVDSPDRKLLNQEFSNIKKSLADLTVLIQDEEHKDQIADINAKFADIDKANTKAFQDIDSMHSYDGLDALNNVLPILITTFSKSVQSLAAELDSHIDTVISNSEKTYNASRIVIAINLAVIFVISFLMIVFVARGIARPIKKAAEFAKHVANGDLTTDIESNDSRDEVGQMTSALSQMNQKLLSILKQISSGSKTIHVASAEIAAGNLDLSSRTEQQASSLEETASVMEELTSTVKQTADNARQANQLASSASTVAVQGGDIVQQVITTMGTINDSSKKIEDIISVIDGIAFQTNILALNASVEAARAGEQGRGFAVVAGEVRNLAQRSATAAKEIKSLIDRSVEDVSFGNDLVNKAGSTMQEVVSSIQRVTDIVGEITAASQEQSSGIEQVNLAISQMDQVTQQNAALVEEATAASQSLQDQTSKLESIVSSFKFSADQIHSSADIKPVKAASSEKPIAAEIKKQLTSTTHAAPVALKKVVKAPVAEKAPVKSAEKTVPTDKTPPAKTTGPATISTAKVRAQSPKSLAPASAADNDDWEEF